MIIEEGSADHLCMPMLKFSNSNTLQTYVCFCGMGIFNYYKQQRHIIHVVHLRQYDFHVKSWRFQETRKSTFLMMGWGDCSTVYKTRCVVKWLGLVDEGSYAKDMAYFATYFLPSTVPFLMKHSKNPLHKFAWLNIFKLWMLQVNFK